VPNSSQSQCDWSKKIAFAIQRRYQTNENACKALAAPPDEFNQAHALIENEMLSQFQFVTDARLNVWLEQHSQRILSQLNSGSVAKRRIGTNRAADPHGCSIDPEYQLRQNAVECCSSPHIETRIRYKFETETAISSQSVHGPD